MDPAVDRLGAGSYVLLTTFRKNGTAVPTPLWVVADGEQFAVWTPAAAGKVKRIRRNPAVTVAPCDVRGRPQGDAVPATARLLDAAGTARVRALLRRKYGLIGRITIAGSRLRRGRAGTIAIAITPTE
ncbi:MAG TPA: PPOX class F420-dependent oxidoreductase [Rugosimonospora sp.]|nr:PPOX class F420-dependent oxidoreductase [Rugosimonospora sp.]